MNSILVDELHPVFPAGVKLVSVRLAQAEALGVRGGDRPENGPKMSAAL
jgi:hypothetical protein